MTDRGPGTGARHGGARQRRKIPLGSSGGVQPRAGERAGAARARVAPACCAHKSARCDPQLAPTTHHPLSFFSSHQLISTMALRAQTLKTVATTRGERKREKAEDLCSSGPPFCQGPPALALSATCWQKWRQRIRSPFQWAWEGTDGEGGRRKRARDSSVLLCLTVLITIFLVLQHQQRRSARLWCARASSAPGA